MQPKTDLEKALLIKQAMQLQQEIIENLQKENTALISKNTCLEAAYGREALDHKAARNLLAERETGLSVIQRIAEAGGLIRSDRDDIRTMYGRGA